MREIKFRGKRVDNGEWVYGDLTRYSGEKSIITVDFLENETYWVKSETVGQYTGLKDKNGVEIYEGDVVKCIYWNYSSVVEFVNGGFEPFVIKNWECEYDADDYIIIGNIHDNPELIEVEQCK